MQTLYKYFTIDVDGPDVSASFNVTNDVEAFSQVQVSSDDLARLYDEGISIEMSIDSNEIFPIGTPVKPLLADTTVPVNGRYHWIAEEETESGLRPVSIERRSGTISVRYKCDYGGVPYRLQLLLKCLGKNRF